MRQHLRAPVPTSPWRPVLVASGVLTVLLLAGCATPTETSPATSPAASPAAATSAARATASVPDGVGSGSTGAGGIGQGTENGPASPGSAPHGAPDSLGTSVASRTTTVSSDGASFRVALDLYALHRDDHWVRLTARLRVLEAPAGAVAPASLLGSNPQDSLTDSQPDGFTLTDTAAGLRYRPAVDAANKPLCSPELPTSWSNGDALYLACVFGAPSAASVTVTTPTFGSFAHVPVS